MFFFGLRLWQEFANQDQDNNPCDYTPDDDFR